MKKIVLVVLLLVACAAWADEIHLNDGRIIKGKIIQVTERHIEYDPEGEKPFDIIPRGQIEKIVYDDGKIVILYEGKDVEPDAEKKPEETPLPVKKAERVPPKDKDFGDDKSGIHIHDGFLLRFHYGFGSGRIVEKNYFGDDREFKGVVGSLRVQVGNEVYTNLILFGEFGFFTMQEPDVKWQGTTVEEANADLAVIDLGIGLTYYIMPYNVYFAGSLNTSATSIDVKGQDEEVGEGYGVYLSIGKEWWISDNWGIGVALFAYFGEAEVENQDLDETFDVQNRFIGIAFSATYN